MSGEEPPAPNERPDSHEWPASTNPPPPDELAAPSEFSYLKFEIPPLPSESSPPPPRPRPIPAPDPWAHRRGEPRVFAFLWTMYVLLAVAGSILWVARFASVSAGSYSPAARIMLVVVAVGATILWPMVRLSQASPKRGAIGHVLADAIIILIPTQLVLWPLFALANWPIDIVAGVAGVLASWVILVGGMLALALSGRSAILPGDRALIGRTIWMAVILAAVCAAPAATLAIGSGRQQIPGWLPMLSPLTAVPILTGAGLSGPQNPVSHIQWELIILIASIGLALWIVASVRSLLGRKREHA